MRLKSLELVGFKSFLDPTTVSFAAGITAVVGPNGCGKSNLIDAIRWVLGEQAPSRLRGKSTEDFIFAGNDSHPAAGMAEVTLVLEAPDQGGLPEPYSALSEVGVTRRVYRLGDCEYLINKVPCRLKDIVELFMAVQVHSRGYALIEQGRVEEIIQAKPPEVRALVEEAAGLALFKGRRDIAESKLRRVRENLARVDDVLAEIERQLDFARRQAKKAEAYKLLRQELDELERLCAGRRLLELASELARESDREAELRGAIEERRARLAAMEAECDSLAASLSALNERIAAENRELDKLRAPAAQRARTREIVRRRLSALDELEPQLVARLAELERRIVAARAARAHLGARLARQSAEGPGDETLAELRRRHGRAQDELRQSQERAEGIKDELSEVVREAAIVRGRLGDLSGERAELDGRLSTLDAGNCARGDALRAAGDALRATSAQLDQCRRETATLERAYRETSERELEARAAAQTVGARVAAMREELGATKSLAPADGAGARLREVVESLNGDRPAGELHLLRDVLRAPPAVEPALRAVLGEYLDAVIVDSPDFALRAIGILKERQAGRLTFIEDAAARLQPVALEAPGIAGRLLDMLTVEARFVPVVQAVLGHVLLADDLGCALAASNLDGHRTVFVTRDGDVLRPGRVISGGSAALQTDNGRRDRMTVEQLLEAVAGCEREHQALTERVSSKRTEREALEAHLEECRRRLTEEEGRLAGANANLAEARQQVALAEAQAGGARRRLEEIAQLVASSNLRLEELAKSEQRLRAHLAAISDELGRRKSAAARIGDEMLAAVSQVEARKSELAALESELKHARALADELQLQIHEHAAAIERSRAERIELEAELSKLAEQDREAGDQGHQLEVSLELLHSSSADQGRELDGRRAALKPVRAELAELEEKLSECALKRERAATLGEELARSFLEKFKVGFNSVASEIEAMLADRDAEHDEVRLGALRAKAERVAEVNLAAASEVQELEERRALLRAEHEDLRKAATDLTQTIQRLNREARRRFAETFDGVAGSFAELLPKLLPGAKGRLELEQSEDGAEAGVSILVQPAGKKVKEIGLLSGGEKALAALALVFALFLLNPSPFCVLDEVDAPLDEFRLAAFTSLLQEMKARSQFIVITHSQRTMQAADQIHGVTMAQPGISRVISLSIPQGTPDPA